MAGRSRDVAGREPCALDLVEQAATNHEPIGTSDTGEQSDDSFRVTQVEARLQDEAGVPARRSMTETLVVLVGEFEEEQEGVCERHERMFP